jgi:hypothetical protein
MKAFLKIPDQSGYVLVPLSQVAYIRVFEHPKPPVVEIKLLYEQSLRVFSCAESQKVIDQLEEL